MNILVILISENEEFPTVSKNKQWGALFANAGQQLLGHSFIWKLLDLLLHEYNHCSLYSISLSLNIFFLLAVQKYLLDNLSVSSNIHVNILKKYICICFSSYLRNFMAAWKNYIRDVM